jgi:hypothetical protein
MLTSCFFNRTNNPLIFASCSHESSFKQARNFNNRSFSGSISQSMLAILGAARLIGKSRFSLEGLGFRVARSPFSGGSNMARYLFFAITLIGVGVLLNSPAEAVTDAVQCDDQAANCVGRCVNPGGGTNSNKCMWYCDRQVKSCLIRVHGAARPW